MLSLMLPSATGLTRTIPLATFNGASGTFFSFNELNDPVMGGKSTGTWDQSGTFGVFDGEVVDVPSLSAPGFIKASADGTFPDVSAAATGSLVLRVRSTTPNYAGFRVSFASGTLSPAYACSGGGSIPLSRGCFKAKFSVPAGADFANVTIPFSSFSDKWSPATGEQTTTCAADSDVCPSASKLTGIKRLEVWAEGALGKVHLEILSVSATFDATQLAAEQAALAARTPYFEKLLMASAPKFGEIEVASPSDMLCPSTAAPLGVACGMQITTTAAASCSTVLSEMRARVNGQYGSWHDPHNNGTYAAQSYGGTFSASRLTGNGKYTDKMIFTLTAASTASCKIEACSRSQVFSIADGGTNYCDLKMLYCGSADGCKPVAYDFAVGAETTSKFSQSTVDLSACLKV